MRTPEERIQFIAEYFDAHSDRERRSNCENIIYEFVEAIEEYGGKYGSRNY